MRPAPHPTSTVGSTILVNDNDECVRDLLRLHLKRAGYEVRLSEDVLAAGKVLFKGRPDLILMDIELPFMDGFEFAKGAKRRSPDLRHPGGLSHCQVRCRTASQGHRREGVPHETFDSRYLARHSGRADIGGPACSNAWRWNR